MYVLQLTPHLEVHNFCFYMKIYLNDIINRGSFFWEVDEIIIQNSLGNFIYKSNLVQENL